MKCRSESIHIAPTEEAQLTATNLANPVAQETRQPPPPCPCEAHNDNNDVDTILALDLGSKTGWALQAEDGSITSGTALFQNDRWTGGGMRYLRFKHWLTEIKQTAHGIDAVFVEEVRRHAGVDAAHAYGGFLAHVTAWCEHHGVAYGAVPVGTIKRHVTGKGNAPKEAVIAAVKSRGFAPGDDNEADAIAILLWALETNGGVR